MEKGLSMTQWDNPSKHNDPGLRLIAERDLGDPCDAVFSANDECILAYQRAKKQISVLLPKSELAAVTHLPQMGHWLDGYSCHPHKDLLAEAASFSGWPAIKSGLLPSCPVSVLAAA